MNRFAKLFTSLDQTTRTNIKIAALAEYFGSAPPADAAWAIYFLSGQKLRRLIPVKLLRKWSAETANIESWLFDECYEIVGDLAEVMALILPAPTDECDLPLHLWVTERLEPLRKMNEDEQRAAIGGYWRELSRPECFVFHKLITGSFRVGVSLKLVGKALAQHSGIDAETIAHRLMGHWEPTAEAFQSLLNPDGGDAAISRPYPFYLAHPIEKELELLGDVADWQAEWKWDGIRAQLIRRTRQTFIWSRGEDLMTERFPELTAAAESLPDGTVIDGEIVAFKDGAILPFSEMQRRIGRKQLGKKILADVPVRMIAFDLIELDGIDVREQSLDWRREKLQSLLKELNPVSLPFAEIETTTIQLSPELAARSWEELAELRSLSRDNQAEGLMLKRRDGAYRVGRPRGEWWKWKIVPYTIDAVLIYAQRGHGRRASLYTDYTFAVWSGDELVPFAKAYSGLTDAEIQKVDRYIRNNTIDRFGPVRSVKPELVFELAFENIQLSTRHKSGIAVRFPRITRWRDDLTITDADNLETIKAMM